MELDGWFESHAVISSLQAVMSLACPVCGKSFGGRNRKQNLGFHMLIHTGEKRHQCPYCPHKSTLKSNLNKHIRTMHSEITTSTTNTPTTATTIQPSLNLSAVYLDEGSGHGGMPNLWE